MTFLSFLSLGEAGGSDSFSEEHELEPEPELELEFELELESDSHPELVSVSVLELLAESGPKSAPESELQPELARIKSVSRVLEYPLMDRSDAF